MIFFLTNTLIMISLVILLISISNKFKLYDIPNKRKIHKNKVPVVGGLAIFFCILISSFIFKYDEAFILSLYISSIIIIIGLIDDIFYLKFYLKLFFQSIAIIFIINSGVYIKNFYLFNFFNNDLLTFIILILFSYLCLLTLLNSINFIDGIDGLSSGLIFLIIIFIFINSFLHNINIDYNNFLIILIPLTIFLFFNLSLFGLKKIFLGDAGSCFLGFFVGCLLIIYSQEPYNYIKQSFIPWLLCIPIYDFLSVSILRILNKKSPFYPDNNHIHHLLLSRSHNQKYVLIIILTIQILFNIYGIIITNYISLTYSIMNFAVFFVFYFIFILKLKKT